MLDRNDQVEQRHRINSILHPEYGGLEMSDKDSRSNLDDTDSKYM